MSIETLGGALRQIKRLFAEGVASGLTDAQLLDRFIEHRDNGAFEAILTRHGPMVLSVCRGILRDPNDAEDAFQATFLVMVKKARTIRGRHALGGWLYQVAHRVAIQANKAAARRRTLEREAGQMATAIPSPGPKIRDELLSALHEEVAQLPRKYRLALVLCDLEGMTQAQAACDLAWSERTLRRRLAWARDRLKARLSRRGLAPDDAMLGAVFLRESRALVPAAWQNATVHAALGVLDHAIALGTVSMAAQSLSREVLKTMFVHKLTLASAALLGAGLMAWATTVALISREDEPSKAATPVAVAQRAAAAAPPQPEPDPLDAVGTFPVRGRVLDPDGKPAANAEIYVRHNVEYGWTLISPVARGQKGRVAVSDMNGRFQFDLDKASSDWPYGAVPPWHKAMIAAPAPGYGLAWVEAGSLANGGEPTLRLERDDVPIHGRVLDTQGRPVAGVTVRLGRVSVLKAGVDLDAPLASGKVDAAQIAASYGNDDVIWPGGSNTWTSDGDGRFEVKGVGRDRLGLLFFHSPALADSSVYVMARPDKLRGLSSPQRNRATDTMGHAVKSLSFDPRVVGATFELVFGPTKPITGVVRLKGSGKPLAGVPVHGSESATGTSVSARTDAEGRFRLVGLPKGEVYQIRAYPKTGIDPFFGKTITVADTEGLKPIETTLELPRGVIVIGRLVDEATGRPVFAGISQYFKLPTNRNEGGGTQKDGGERAGHLSLTDPTFRLTVPPGEGALCAVPRAREVPYTCARLSKADEEKVDAMVRELLPGFSACKIIDVPDTAEPFTVELKLTRGSSRRGRVVGPDGKPVTGAQCDGLVAMMAGEVSILADDTFEVLGLEPGLPRQLVFAHKDRGLVGSILIKGEDVNNDTPLEVRLDVSGSVKGRLVDEEGIPLSGAKLELVSSGLLPEVSTFTADADGRFQIVGLIPGIKSNIGVEHKTRPNYRIDTGGVLFNIIMQRTGEVRDLGDVRVKEVPQ
jgi:RNA polymerase sigma factor (sigma-70 family)